jgi:hypothetical protein
MMRKWKNMAMDWGVGVVGNAAFNFPCSSRPVRLSESRVGTALCHTSPQLRCMLELWVTVRRRRRGKAWLKVYVNIRVLFRVYKHILYDYLGKRFFLTRRCEFYSWILKLFVARGWLYVPQHRSWILIWVPKIVVKPSHRWWWHCVYESVYICVYSSNFFVSVVLYIYVCMFRFIPLWE